VREPDAANLHVRFDERGVETGATGDLVRHRHTKGAATDRVDLKPPASHSDSTKTTSSPAKVERRLWDQKGDDRRSAPQRARRADSGHGAVMVAKPVSLNPMRSLARRP